MLLAVTEGKSDRHVAAAPEAPAREDGAEAGNEDAFREYAPLEATTTGENCPEDRMGNQLIHTSLAVKLQYERHERRQTEDGAEYVFFLKDEDTGMAARLHYRFYAELNVISCHTEVENRGTLPRGLRRSRPFPCTGWNGTEICPMRSASVFTWYITAGRRNCSGTLTAFRSWGFRPPRSRAGTTALSSFP